MEAHFKGFQGCDTTVSFGIRFLIGLATDQLYFNNTLSLNINFHVFPDPLKVVIEFRNLQFRPQVFAVHFCNSFFLYARIKPANTFQKHLKLILDISTHSPWYWCAPTKRFANVKYFWRAPARGLADSRSCWSRFFISFEQSVHYFNLTFYESQICPEKAYPNIISVRKNALRFCLSFFHFVSYLALWDT